MAGIKMDSNSCVQQEKDTLTEIISNLLPFGVQASMDMWTQNIQVIFKIC